MANEINLYNDICDLDELIEHSITKKQKSFWQREKQKVLKELKDNYPDMFWE